MALRRMFAKAITDSDDFLDLPLDVQLLYFHLGMQADDDGMLNSTRKIIRLLGVEPDALRILCDTGFVLCFPSGVVAIRHWRVNNKLRRDRHTVTQFQEEWKRLTVCNDVYEYRKEDDNQVTTQSREGESREGENSVDEWSVDERSVDQWSAVEWTEERLEEKLEEKLEEERGDEERIEEEWLDEGSAGVERKEKKRIDSRSADQETRVAAAPVEFSTNPQPTVLPSMGVEKETLFVDLDFQRKKEEAIERLRNYRFDTPAAHKQS